MVPLPCDVIVYLPALCYGQAHWGEGLTPCRDCTHFPAYPQAPAAVSALTWTGAQPGASCGGREALSRQVPSQKPNRATGLEPRALQGWGTRCARSGSPEHKGTGG